MPCVMTTFILYENFFKDKYLVLQDVLFTHWNCMLSGLLYLLLIFITVEKSVQYSQMDVHKNVIRN